MVRFPIEYAEVDQLYRQTIAQGLSVITIASVDQGEGTSTLCRTLAQRAAAAGQKTLVIDLDIAHSQMHKSYDLDQEDWYPTQADPLPIQHSAYDNLSVLCAPTHSANRWEFRDLASLLALLNCLRESYEIIIIDTSPLGRRNQGNVPAETLCTCSDGTVLCVLSGLTSESRLRDAADLLRSVNANIHGAVMNDRFSPSLVSELIRETYRFKKRLPKLGPRIRRLLRNSTLLNQDI